MTDDNYELVLETPSVEDYLRVRREAGLGAKSVEAAERGLPNTLLGVQVRHKGETVGIMRLIGDDGCFYAAVDGAVLPEHQTSGIGRMMLQAIIDHFNNTAPPGAYLMGTTVAPGFVKKLGFKFVEPNEQGIYMWIPCSHQDT